ncbi:thermonuclease family protein [Mesorhizobium sp. BE184]|uniref:thermonuclease family protein n=1 Tax=Mesorhizobium sp. BE184 TaxID=2817714 RepID=UPI0028638045|nr:thermonuclease family protein [Mesorhizobium sp. BE184]MDR7033231.1 endonuclease YncB(thermonuclease family) [Mesorhizobium sp. BE184]
MKAAHGAVAGLILVGLSVAILAGKQIVVAAQDVPILVDAPEDIPLDAPMAQDDTSEADAAQADSANEDATGKDATAAVVPPQIANAPGPRAFDPELSSSESHRDGAFERIAPRAPLSELALAAPPKPPKQTKPEDWKGTPLFQPVAKAAGLIDAKGYSVAVSGIDMVGVDKTCTDAGKEWACGQRARTAFRGFLRGRAVVCKVPPENGRDIIAAECRIGKEDVGQWLVENGWARAASGGPYAEAGKKAETDRKGIFGPPPERIRMMLSPGASSLPAPPSVSTQAATPEEVVPALPDIAPPSELSATPQVFPPAPRR